jgi:hypothetical protein
MMSNTSSDRVNGKTDADSIHLRRAGGRNPPSNSGQVGVKLRVSLRDALSYVSAQTLVFPR